MMNDNPMNDPALQSLAARLAAVPPRLHEREREQLLFQCGMAAGRNTAARRVRHWQAASGVLAVLLAGLSLMLSHGQPPAIARKPAVSSTSTQPSESEQDDDLFQWRVAQLDLSAWQRHNSSSADFAQELTRFKQMDPSLRAFAVGTLSHTFALEQ
jgi:hypothetical protein